jgi:hypothetical protein
MVDIKSIPNDELLELYNTYTDGDKIQLNTPELLEPILEKYKQIEKNYLKLDSKLRNKIAMVDVDCVLEEYNPNDKYVIITDNGYIKSSNNVYDLIDPEFLNINLVGTDYENEYVK